MQDGVVWGLSQLAAHMGKGPFSALWQDMQRSTAMVLAAALPRALEVSAASFVCVCVCVHVQAWQHL